MLIRPLAAQAPPVDATSSPAMRIFFRICVAPPGFGRHGRTPATVVPERVLLGTWRDLRGPRAEVRGAVRPLTSPVCPAHRAWRVRHIHGTREGGWKRLRLFQAES